MFDFILRSWQTRNLHCTCEHEILVLLILILKNPNLCCVTIRFGLFLIKLDFLLCDYQIWVTVPWWTNMMEGREAPRPHPQRQSLPSITTCPLHYTCVIREADLSKKCSFFNIVQTGGGVNPCSKIMSEIVVCSGGHLTT